MNQYKNQMIGGVMSVWLQYCGWHAAKPGRELVVGDKLVYNGGYTGEIAEITKETNKSIFVTISENGKLYPNIKIGKDTYKPLSLNNPPIRANQLYDITGQLEGGLI